MNETSPRSSSIIPCQYNPIIERIPAVSRNSIRIPTNTFLHPDYFDTAEWTPTKTKYGEKIRYELHHLADIGGFAFVFRATDKLSGSIVAIKTLLPEFANDVAHVTRFREEAAIHLSLRHKNIVPAYDYFEYSGRQFLVSEYVHFPTVKQHIEWGTLQLNDSIQIIRQLINASKYCLAHDIIDTDVKPGNIFFDKTSQAALLSDFGIIKHINKPSNGEVLEGTLPHMTPEQMRGLPIGIDAIPYYKGVLLFEMITGVKMLEHTTPDGKIDIRRTTQTIDRRSTDPGRMMLLQEALKKNNVKFTPVEEKTLWANCDDVHFLQQNLHPFIFMLFKATNKDPLSRYQTIEEFDIAFDESVTALEQPWVPIPTYSPPIEIYYN